MLVSSISFVEPHTGNRREVTFWKAFFKTLAKIELLEVRNVKLHAF